MLRSSVPQRAFPMNEEAAFLAAIRESPRAAAPRMIYADWLEERGDPRAEFVRNQHQLATGPWDGDRRERLLARQRQLRTGIDREWLARLGYRHWPLELTAADFEREVLHAPVAVARFWAPWSAPCLRFATTVVEVAEAFAGLAVVGNVNVDEQAELAQRYAITAVPTTLFFADSRQSEVLIGVRPPAALRDILINLCSHAAR